MAASLLFLLVLLAPAASLDVAVAVRTAPALMVGLAREVVYDSSVQPRYTVSVLDWAMEPAFLVTTEARAQASFGLTAILSLGLAVPGESGFMTDSDYLNYDGEVTHFSRHTCLTEGGIFLDARLGWSIPLGAVLAIEPFAAFTLIRLKWSARDGYLQYPPEASAPYTVWYPEAPQTRLYGTGIIYEQRYAYPSLGLAASLRPAAGLQVSLALAASPYVFCSDRDSHLLRQVSFDESFAGGFAVEPSLEVSYALTGRATASLTLCYRYIGGLVGDSSLEGTGVQGTPPPIGSPWPGERWTSFVDWAGASLSVFRASLGLSLSS